MVGNDRTPKLNCDSKDCPVELFHPPEDCNVNSSLSFTLQVFYLFFVKKISWCSELGYPIVTIRKLKDVYFPFTDMSS